MENLHYGDSLEDFTVPELKTRCEILKKLFPDIKIQSLVRKNQFVEFLVLWFDSKTNLSNFYNILSQIEKETLQEAVYSHSGKVDVNTMIAKYGNCVTLTISSYGYSYGEKKQAHSPLGIIFSKSSHLPHDLLARFKGIVPEPKKTKVDGYDEVPSSFKIESQHESELDIVVHETEHPALYDVISMLRLCEQNSIGVGEATGNVGSSGATKIREVLFAGDFYAQDVEADSEYDIQMGVTGIRPFAWPHILQSGKLAKIEKGKLSLSRSGAKAITLPAHEVIKELWESWIKTNQLHELSRIDIISGQKSKGHPLYPASVGRSNIAKGLLSLPPNKWVLIEDFLKFIIATSLDFEIARNPWALFINDKQHGSLGYNHITWDHIEGRFTLAFLLEYAATMGIIDVAITEPWGSVVDHRDLWGAEDCDALSRYDGLKYIRLTSLGQWVLGLKSSYEQKEFKRTTQFKFLPNLELALTSQKILPTEKLLIERFCNQTSDNLWTLSKKKILDLVEEGKSIEDIEKDLATFSPDGSLPPVFRTYFDDIKKKTNHLSKVGSYVLIDCMDEPTAILLANDREIKKYTTLVLNKQLLVLEKQEENFKKHVKKLGLVLASK